MKFLKFSMRWKEKWSVKRSILECFERKSNVFLQLSRKDFKMKLKEPNNRKKSIKWLCWLKVVILNSMLRTKQIGSPSVDLKVVELEKLQISAQYRQARGRWVADLARILWVSVISRTRVLNYYLARRLREAQRMRDEVVHGIDICSTPNRHWIGSLGSNQTRGVWILRWLIFWVVATSRENFQTWGWIWRLLSTTVTRWGTVLSEQLPK